MFNPLTGIRDIMWAFNFNVRFFGLVYIKLALDMINIKSVLKEFPKFLCLLCDVLLLLSRPYNVVLHPMHCNARCVRMFWSCSSSTSTLCLSESSSLGKTWIKFLSNFQVCCKITKFSAHHHSPIPYEELTYASRLLVREANCGIFEKMQQWNISCNDSLGAERR